MSFGAKNSARDIAWIDGVVKCLFGTRWGRYQIESGLYWGVGGMTWAVVYMAREEGGEVRDAEREITN